MTAAIQGRYEANWVGDDRRLCRVVAIGESSLTAEGLDDPAQLWLHRALRVVHGRSGRSIDLVVLAQSGAHLRNALQQARLVDEERPDVVVLCIGTNDALHPWELLIQNYPARLRRLFRLVRAPGRTVVATGVGDLWYSPALTTSRIRRAFRYVASASSWYTDRAIRRAAGNMPDVQFLSTRAIDQVMWAGRDWLYSDDLLHPSAAGHIVWATHAATLLETAVDPPPEPRAPRPRSRTRHRDPLLSPPIGYVATSQGVARVRDQGGVRRAVVVIPDAPNVLEHHESSFRLLGDEFRVVGLEMPGAGYTDLRRRPGRWFVPEFDYSLAAGARWIRDVMNALGIEHAILTGSCVNGLYAAMLADIDPERVDALVLCQTPSLAGLQRWGRKEIPGPIRNRVLSPLLLTTFRNRLARNWYGKVLNPGVPADERVWFEDVAQEGYRGGAAWILAPLIRAIIREEPDRIGPLTRPVTILWGRHDRSHRHARTDPDSGPGPHGDPVLVEAGHFPDLEDPETFAAAVREAADRVSDAYR